jgi:urea carboxylase
VTSHVTGSLWEIKLQVGDMVTEGDTVVIVESMKMEITVTAPCSGRISHIFCTQGAQVSAGQNLYVINMETENQ